MHLQIAKMEITFALVTFVGETARAMLNENILTCIQSVDKMCTFGEIASGPRLQCVTMFSASSNGKLGTVVAGGNIVSHPPDLGVGVGMAVG